MTTFTPRRIPADGSGPPFAVGAVVSARPWRGDLQRHCRDHVAGTVVRMVRDARDALEEPIEVLVVDDDTSYLSAPFVVRLRERGVVTVGLYDPDEADGHGYRYLLSVGVDLALPSTLPPEELLDALAELRPDAEVWQDFGGVVGDVEDRIEPERRCVVAVGGPAGAGGTEVSIALAQALAGRAPTVLVDLDDVHPSIARRLGLGLHPHVVTAVDALRREKVDLRGEQVLTLDDCLARPVVGGPTPFAVVAGLAARDDWSLLRADDAGDLVYELSARWSFVVARTGPILEDLGRWVPRYEVARRTLERATSVVGVCDASPLGVLRFLDWLTDAVDVVPVAAIDVAINRCPRSPAQRAELVEQLREAAGDRVGRVVALPCDRRVARAAWDAEAVAGGPFVKALRCLADAVAEVAP